MVNVKEIQSFKDYGRVVSISNGVIEAMVSIDVGPRIVSFGYLGGQNFMNTDRKGLGGLCDEKYEDFFGKGRKWESMGGHRIWLSPESYPETYLPDDRPVEYTVTENGAIFNPLPDSEVGAQKYMEIKMDKDDTNMELIMRIKNISDKEKEFSIWSLSVCAKGGTLILPTNRIDTGLLPNRIVSVWPYTDMSNDRIYWGNKYITLRQDDKYENPVKIGVDLNCGRAYYVMGDDILCKEYETKHPTAAYPDGGCSFESYTNALMLEFETLGELKKVAPQETSELIEHWSLCKKPCEVDFKNDDSIDNLLSEI